MALLFFVFRCACGGLGSAGKTTHFQRLPKVASWQPLTNAYDFKPFVKDCQRLPTPCTASRKWTKVHIRWLAHYPVVPAPGTRGPRFPIESQNSSATGAPGYTATGDPSGPGMVASCGTPSAWKMLLTSSCGVTGRSAGSLPLLSD